MEQQRTQFRRCDGCEQLKNCIETGDIVQSMTLDGRNYERPEWNCPHCLVWPHLI